MKLTGEESKEREEKGSQGGGAHHHLVKGLCVKVVELEVLKYLFNTNWPDYTSNRHRFLIYLASQSHNQRIRTLLRATRKDLITNITSLSLDLAKLREKGN